MESSKKYLTTDTVEDVIKLTKNRITRCQHWVFNHLPIRTKLRVLQSAVRDLQESGLLFKLRIVKEGRTCPWDPKLKFYHVMAMVGESNGSSRICSTGDGSDEILCQLKAWAEFYERLGMHLNRKFGCEMSMGFRLFPNAIDPHNDPGKITSNGCSLHFNIWEASKRAILELIERDAFLGHWYTKTPASRLETDDPHMPTIIQKMALHLKTGGWELDCFRLTSLLPNIHPVFMMARNTISSSSAQLFVGFGCDTNIQQALLNAYVEVAKFYTKLHAIQDVQELSLKLPGDVRRYPFGRMIYYQDSHRKMEFDFFKNSKIEPIELFITQNPKTNLFLQSIFKSFPRLSLHFLPIPKTLKGIVYIVKAYDPGMIEPDFEVDPVLRVDRLNHYGKTIYYILHPIP